MESYRAQDWWLVIDLFLPFPFTQKGNSAFCMSVLFFIKVGLPLSDHISLNIVYVECSTKFKISKLHRFHVMTVLEHVNFVPPSALANSLNLMVNDGKGWREI